MPVKLEIIENRTVGPTLGQDSKEASQKAFLIGVAGVFVFMILFYRLSGVVADIALLLYTMLLLLVMRYLNATLTLPGMAGIILSIGMAVDANVLIFERFKEEIRTGKTLRKAMDNGFGRALVTILDSNITTLMACAVGFAVTLSIGVILSMFSAVTVTKFLLKFLIDANFTKSPTAFGISTPKAEEVAK